MVTIESTPEMAANVYETMERNSRLSGAGWAGH